jgi:DNA polymerase
MREIYLRLPRWNYSEDERRLWILDQAVNDRGVAIDLDLVQSARRAVAETQASLAEQLQRLTDGALMSANQRDAVLTYIYDTYDLRLDDLQGSTLDQLIADPDTPEGLRTLLRLRSAAATTSVAKYDALHRSTSSDGRLRGTLQFCGAARTGRWAGRLFQPQNLKRSTLSTEEIEGFIEALKLNVEDII